MLKIRKTLNQTLNNVHETFLQLHAKGYWYCMIFMKAPVEFNYHFFVSRSLPECRQKVKHKITWKSDIISQYLSSTLEVERQHILPTSCLTLSYQKYLWKIDFSILQKENIYRSITCKLYDGCQYTDFTWSLPYHVNLEFDVRSWTFFSLFWIKIG